MSTTMGETGPIRATAFTTLMTPTSSSQRNWLLFWLPLPSWGIRGALSHSILRPATLGLLRIASDTLKPIPLKRAQADLTGVLKVRRPTSNPLPLLVLGLSKPGGIAARMLSSSTQAAQVNVLEVSTWALTTLVLGLSTPGLSLARTSIIAPKLTTQVSLL